MAVRAHGTAGAYRGGCRCVKCKAGHAQKAREDRARNPVIRTRRAKPKVVALPTTTEIPVATIGMGRNERAVRDECDTLERAQERVSTVAMAVTLAQRLDDPNHAAMAATNSRQLQSLMNELRSPKKKMAGKRLASVQAMVAPRRKLAQ